MNPMETIFKDLPGKKADLILLILASQGIFARAQPQIPSGGRGAQFDILVPGEQMTAAAKSVDRYFQENSFSGLSPEPRPHEISSFNTPGAYGIMAILLAIHLICQHLRIHQEVILKFGASSLYINQGETFRAITALFLHSDGQHLLGNLAGILIFAAPVISLTGYGTGPFLLLWAGASGNLINAHFHQTGLLSIGASTAVMGAAGVLAAFQMTLKGRPFQLKGLIPLFAGATLVGLFSQGENTDLSAHVFGFGAGVFWGCLFFPFFRVIRNLFYPGLLEPLALVFLFLILGAAIRTGL